MYLSSPLIWKVFEWWILYKFSGENPAAMQTGTSHRMHSTAPLLWLFLMLTITQYLILNPWRTNKPCKYFIAGDNLEEKLKTISVSGRMSYILHDYYSCNISVTKEVLSSLMWRSFEKLLRNWGHKAHFGPNCACVHPLNHHHHHPKSRILEDQFQSAFLFRFGLIWYYYDP